MYYAVLSYGNMLETDRWVPLYWMITLTLSSRFTFLMDTYISEECTAAVFMASTLTMTMMALCSSTMLVPTYHYTTQCHNLAYSNSGIHHCENYKFSHIDIISDKHPQVISKKHSIAYYPKHCTSILQPFDFGINKCFKQLHKKHLVQKFVCLMYSE